jgi:LytS/YehU family sensor histidine kinase
MRSGRSDGIADAESAAQAAQVRALAIRTNPALPVQHAQFPVLTGDDRTHGSCGDDVAGAFHFLRTSLSLDPTADVSLAEEIDLQRLYLDIEKARFPDRLQVEIEVPQSLEQARLPALILQPIVENAIKYGVSKSRKTVIIRIEARHLGDGRMVVDISNRLRNGGKDSAKAATHEGTGLGLANVCQRLDARFGSRATCRFGPMLSGGYKVSLTVPVETNA